jgi:ADP-ribose pyrophosphatase YjhB (NUDIX family)
MRDRPGRPRFMLGAGVAVVSPDDRLLVLQQEHDGIRDWGYPGGGLESGETIQECAVRETLEESGLRVIIVRLLSVTEFWRDGRMDGMGFMFLARPDPWPQEVRTPERDGETLFLSHRWLDRLEFDSLAGNSEFDFAGLPWPQDVTEVVWRREGSLGR